MSNEEKGKKAKVIILQAEYDTPIGEAHWCKLFRPDTQWDADGKYEASILLDSDSPAAIKIKEDIDAFAAAYQKEAKKKVNSLPYSDYLDKDGEETGQIKVKASLKAKGMFGPRRPAVYDGAGKQLTAPVDIGNGSSVRLKVKVKGFSSGAVIGISLEIIAAQIIRLKEFTGGGGGNSGFGAVEGAYVAPEDQGGSYSEEGDAEASGDY